MDPAAQSRKLRSEGRRLLELAPTALDADVPSCPDWVGRELLGHVVEVWQAIEALISDPSPERPDFGALPSVPTDDAALLAFADDTFARLVVEVADADPAQPTWTWSSDHTVGFFQRRVHQETLVHRIDMEQAVDLHTPVEPTDALDGIDELFSVLVSPTGEAMPAGSLHLHQTDGDGAGEFLLDVVGDEIVMTREHAKGDAALRGSAEDLWMAVWRRRGLDGLDLFGNEDVALQWMGLAP
jgi:uncharacterized protein (TIGR03083 family)